jgi:hypothetical protein
LQTGFGEEEVADCWVRVEDVSDGSEVMGCDLVIENLGLGKIGF